MKKRKEQAKKTRQKIIDATRNLCEEKETDEITIEDITRRAGVASGTFYLYFKRKEDVISEITYEQFFKIIDMVLKSQEDVYEIIKRFLEESIKVIVENTLPIAQQWMKYSVAPLPGEENGKKKYHFDLNFIEERLKSAVEKGELIEDTPVKELAMEITAEFYGIIALWCITEGKVSPEERMQSYCEYSLKKIIQSFKR